MACVYSEVDDLDDHDDYDLVGTQHCVVLVQTYTAAARAADWKHSVSVRGRLLLAKGTGIATFEDGVYKNQPHGNHAAFYLSQDQGGIRVMDQWKGPNKLTVSKHDLVFKGVDKNGRWLDASNHGDAFSVIE